MAIYAISDLHLSFNTNKPMNVFGWENYEERIKEDWNQKVTQEDTVLLPGDFSWAMNLKDTDLDFQYIHALPGKKILLKGNHDYWWNTLTSMRNYMKKRKIDDIDFLYNNSYKIENTIICGTRGWIIGENDEENQKIYKRELQRLKLSLEDGMKKYRPGKDMIVCMHYPPIKDKVQSDFVRLMEEYPVKQCIYGHLHGSAHNGAIEGNFGKIEYKMVSCDYTDFKLIRIK